MTERRDLERRKLHPLRRSSDRIAVEAVGTIEEQARALHLSEMFTGILAHDLRNPLAAIMTSAAVLIHRAESNVAAKPAKRILNSAERMNRMIGQLLDFTRIRLGTGLPVEREEMNLATVCQIIVDELISVHGCPISVEQAGDLSGQWDADRLSQLLSNLLGNACQHRREDSVVGLRVDGSAAHRVSLEVRNEGVIPAELLPVIFEPLQTGIGWHRKGKSGLGLGLYISREIVLAHKGTISAESREEEGTRFRVELPRRAPV